MRKLAGIFLLTMFTLSIWASTVEDLKKDLTTAAPDERIEILRSLSSELIYKDPEESIYYSKIGLEEVEPGSEDNIFFLENSGLAYEYNDFADSALVFYKKQNVLAFESGNDKLIAESQFRIGSALSVTEDFSVALTYLNLALDKFKQHHDLMREAICYNEIGYCYEMKSMHAKALDNYFKAYKIYLKMDDKTGLGNSTVNIGNVYNSLKNNSKSLEYYELGKEYYTEVQDTFGLASVINNIGNIFNEDNKPKQALDYYKRSLQLTDQETDRAGYTVTLNNIGSVSMKLDFMDKAYSYFKQALVYALEQDNKQNIVSSYMGLHEYFHKIDVSDSAFVYLQKAYLLAKKEDQKDSLQNCYKFYSEYYSKHNDYEKALEYSLKYIALHDTIYGDVNAEIAEIQNSYENIEKQIEIEALTKEKKLQDKLRYYLIALVVVLMVLALLFFSLFTQKQREVKIIEEMEKQKAQETSLRSIIYNISQVANETNDINKIYEAVKLNFSKVIDTTNFFIAFYDKEKDYFNCPITDDINDKYDSYPAGKTLSAYVVNTRKAFLGSDKMIKELIRRGKVIQHGTGSKCWLGVPLFVGTGLLGVMAVQSYKDDKAFNNKDLEMMNFFASQISNILKRIITDNELIDSENRFRILTQNSNAAIFTVDKKGYFKFANPTVERISGYKLSELREIRATNIIHPDHQELLVERISNWLDGRHYQDNQYKFITKSGKTRWMELTSSLVDLKGESYILCSALDITDSKNYEETILTSLKEKEILLKEIHHRVKNNMQIISSLLKLQSKYIEDEEVRELFNISQDRVRSMSLVHENLYSSPDLANIHVESYIRNLIMHLKSSYINDSEQIKVKYDLAKIDISINNAIPCGLILNELLTNCLKYAFPDGREGVVKISFNQQGDKNIFKVEDNGIGIPQDFKIEESDSLGLQLVSSLVIQLHGKLELISNNGTTFIISFPKEDR